MLDTWKTRLVERLKNGHSMNQSMSHRCFRSLGFRVDVPSMLSQFRV
jgi:hypothetical protein